MTPKHRKRIQRHAVGSLNTGIFSYSIVAIFCFFCSVGNLAAASITINTQSQTQSSTQLNAQWTNAAPTTTAGMGTLFLTPAERAALEAARRKRSAPLPSVTPKIAPEEIQALPESATISGFMKRSDGTTAVWVNGVIAPHFSRVNAQQLTPSDVGMAQSGTDLSAKLDAPSSRAKAVAPALAASVTASNQTKPAKRRTNTLDSLKLPKLPTATGANILLKPAAAKTRKN